MGPDLGDTGQYLVTSELALDYQRETVSVEGPAARPDKFAEPEFAVAFVRIEAHPEGERDTRVASADVISPSSGANASTEDLAAHFAG